MLKQVLILSLLTLSFSSHGMDEDRVLYYLDAQGILQRCKISDFTMLKFSISPANTITTNSVDTISLDQTIAEYGQVQQKINALKKEKGNLRQKHTASATDKDEKNKEIDGHLQELALKKLALKTTLNKLVHAAEHHKTPPQFSTKCKITTAATFSLSQGLQQDVQSFSCAPEVFTPPPDLSSFLESEHKSS